MEERDITNEMISYDKVDPLPTENPFYYKENSAVNKFIAEKEKKFPYIRMTIFAIIIPLMAFLMGCSILVVFGILLVKLRIFIILFTMKMLVVLKNILFA